MRKVFSGLTALVMLAVVVQFYLAASAAFSTASKETAFAPHRTFGYIILLLTIILIAIAALTRMPSRIIGLCGMVVGLTILQPLIAFVAKALNDSGSSTTASTVVFGLHAVNALIIFTTLRRLLQASREGAATGATRGNGSPAASPAAERSAS
jgi:hypothetical protein